MAASRRVVAAASAAAEPKSKAHRQPTQRIGPKTQTPQRHCRPRYKAGAIHTYFKKYELKLGLSRPTSESMNRRKNKALGILRHFARNFQEIRSLFVQNIPEGNIFSLLFLPGLVICVIRSYLASLKNEYPDGGGALRRRQRAAISGFNRPPQSIVPL